MATVRSLNFKGKTVAVPVPNVFEAENGVVQFSDEGTATVTAKQAKALVAAFPTQIEEVVEEAKKKAPAKKKSK